MKPRTVFISVFVFLSLFALSGFTPNEIKKDFAQFDKAFIPPLALTNAGKLGPSRKGMAILKERWSVLKSKYYDDNPNDPKWKEGFDQIEKQIERAARIVKGGKDLMAAHEALEVVRHKTLELRRRNKIDYFIDLLTEFHTEMETIYHTGADNSPEDMDDVEIQNLSEATADAVALWNKIGATQVDKAVFGFNDQQIMKMKKLHKNESAALAHLEKELKGFDKEAMLAAAKGVKENYAKFYKIFGDFADVMK